MKFELDGAVLEVDDEPNVAPEPDPSTGTFPVLVNARLILEGGEAREQAVYVGDVRTGAAAHGIMRAVEHGIKERLPTLNRRLANDPENATPQRLFQARPRSLAAEFTPA